jgi:hypothetical protein
VERGILAFGKEHAKRFDKVCDSTTPIHINHPKKKMLPILYHPDAHFITRLGKRHIFEILDSELSNENLIIADILLACLSPNTSHLVFIVPREEDQDKVMDLAITITDNLLSKGVSQKELPKFRAVYYILRTEAKTPESVTEILSDLL